MSETYTPVITFGRYTCAIGLEAGTGKQRLVVLVDYVGGGAPTPPVKTGNPTISGTTQVGQVLTAVHGTYTGTVTGYTSNWYSSGILAQVGGLTYTQVSGDVGNNMTYQEAAFNTGPVYASATGTSNALGPVTAASTFGGAGTLSAPILGYPSPVASNPTTISIAIGNDWQSGDVLKVAYSASESINPFTLLTHTLVDADVAGGAVVMGIPTLGAATFFQACGSHSGVDSANLSNKVKWGDTTAPTITSSATVNQTELLPLAFALTANETVSWTITGGTDQAQFALAGSTLEWYANGTQDFTAPTDSDGNNTYAVQVTATDLGGNATNQTVTVTVAAADKTPDAYTFTSVIPSTPSTVYTSNTITVAGITAGISVAVVLSGAGTYSKNGGAFTSANGTAQLGDTFALKTTSGPGGSDVVTLTLAIGLGSANWIVSNTAVTTQFNTSDKSTNTLLSNGNLTSGNNDATNIQLVRTNETHVGHRQIEFTVGGTPGEMVCGVDDGTITFTGTLGTNSAVTIPGHTNTHGVMFINGSWGWEVHYNGIVFSDYASGNKAIAAAQVISMVFDLTPASGSRTVSVYRTISGSTVLLGTVTGLSFTTLSGYAGTNAGTTSTGTWTMNAGASAFTRTLGGGEVAFGS